MLKLKVRKYLIFYAQILCLYATKNLQSHLQGCCPGWNQYYKCFAQGHIAQCCRWDTLCDPQPRSESITLPNVLPQMLPSFPIIVTVRCVGLGVQWSLKTLPCILINTFVVCFLESVITAKLAIYLSEDRFQIRQNRKGSCNVPNIRVFMAA